MATTLGGIDVSAHQATTPGLGGLSFLVARAAYGTAADPLFRTHLAAARRAGLVTGAYLFLLPGDMAPIRDQVAVLLGAIAGAGGVDLVAIDQEGEATHRAPTNAETRQAIEIVQSTGQACGLYHSTSGYPTDANGADWRWVADYRPLDRPPIPWDVWQYRGSPLDLDRFDGTVDQLRSLGRAADVTPATITDETPKVVTAGIVDWYDLDGKTVVSPKAGHSSPLSTPRPSPYGVGSKRAIYATVGGIRRTVLVTPATVTPVPSCAAQVTAALEAAAIRAADAVRHP